MGIFIKHTCYFKFRLRNLEVAEAIAFHELGHYYNQDHVSVTRFTFATDCFRFGVACTGDFYTSIAANTLSILAEVAFRSFREKEADRFSMLHVKDGAQKTILSLASNVDSYLGIWKTQGYNLKEGLTLGAANSYLGTLAGHPVEHQRLTWAIEEQKHSSQNSTSFQELVRFCSVPFHGDIDGIEQEILEIRSKKSKEADPSAIV